MPLIRQLLITFISFFFISLPITFSALFKIPSRPRVFLFKRPLKALLSSLVNISLKILSLIISYFSSIRSLRFTYSLRTFLLKFKLLYYYLIISYLILIIKVKRDKELLVTYLRVIYSTLRAFKDLYYIVYLIKQLTY